LGVARGANDAAKVAGIDLGDGDEAFFAEKTAGTFRVAVAAPNGVALAFEKLCEEGSGGAGS